MLRITGVAVVAAVVAAYSAHGQEVDSPVSVVDQLDENEATTLAFCELVVGVSLLVNGLFHTDTQILIALLGDAQTDEQRADFAGALTSRQEGIKTWERWIVPFHDQCAFYHRELDSEQYEPKGLFR
ncbi:MAG: hypothetical protein OXF88_06145 [Rhodobacteraceae bacterium]|nr:hypothetical protein [Paracoccaceae bacterium]MCY4139233.1 hypothetical protein [Paracoccaceae bacterium]